MNSLEFVNENINWTISMIKYYEERLLKFKGKNKERSFFYIFECQCLNHYKEELEKFKQIKNELEGLKIIKNRVPKNVILDFVYLEEENIVEKALEVKE